MGKGYILINIMYRIIDKQNVEFAGCRVKLAERLRAESDRKKLENRYSLIRGNGKNALLKGLSSIHVCFHEKYRN